MEAHPAAALFPLMGEEELAALAEDIRANGLSEPIVRHEGKILDGRNRHAACKLAGVQPRFCDWPSKDASGKPLSPTAYVLSLNLHRRHLTPAQRAAVAAEALPLFEAEAAERKAAAGREAGKRGGRGKKAERKGPGTRARTLMEQSPQEQRARDQAAAVLGVSGRAVGQAKRIKEADPEAFERVKAGEVSLRQAERQVAQPRARPATSVAASQPAPAEPTDQEREAFARIADAVSALQREYSQAIEAQGAFLGPLMKTTKGALTAMHHALDDLRRKM